MYTKQVRPGNIAGFQTGWNDNGLQLFEVAKLKKL